MHGRWKALLAGGFISSEKYARLTRNSYTFSDEEKAGFINRQLVETSQATKAITRIFSQAFDNDTKIVFSKHPCHTQRVVILDLASPVCDAHTSQL